MDVFGWREMPGHRLGVVDQLTPAGLLQYTQVPRILAPIGMRFATVHACTSLTCMLAVRTMERIDELAAAETTAGFLKDTFGSVKGLKMLILRDFFRLGFNGDGRLTA